MTVHAGEAAKTTGTYKCTRCGATFHYEAGQEIQKCPKCGNDEYTLME